MFTAKSHLQHLLHPLHQHGLCPQYLHLPINRPLSQAHYLSFSELVLGFKHVPSQPWQNQYVVQARPAALRLHFDHAQGCIASHLQLMTSMRPGVAMGPVATEGTITSLSSLGIFCLSQPHFEMFTIGGFGWSAVFHSSTCRWARHPWRCALHSVTSNAVRAGSVFPWLNKLNRATFGDDDWFWLYKAKKKNIFTAYVICKWHFPLQHNVELHRVKHATLLVQTPCPLQLGRK